MPDIIERSFHFMIGIESDINRFDEPALKEELTPIEPLPVVEKPIYVKPEPIEPIYVKPEQIEPIEPIDPIYVEPDPIPIDPIGYGDGHIDDPIDELSGGAYVDPFQSDTVISPPSLTREEYEDVLNQQEEVLDKLNNPNNEDVGLMTGGDVVEGEDLPNFDMGIPYEAIEEYNDAEFTAEFGSVSNDSNGGEAIEPESVQVANEGGYTRDISGIKVTGYNYSYAFLAMTAAGGGVGAVVARLFKQNTIGYLSLIAAGLMGASAVAFKIKPPVKM